MISSRIQLCLMCVVLFAHLALAPAMAQEDSKFAIIDESLQDLNIVVGAGIGGAVLGLSTLSFVDKPSEHLKNVIVGGALGIITGVAIVSISQANKSRNLYYENALRPTFSTSERYAWHQSEWQKNITVLPHLITHQFSF